MTELSATERAVVERFEQAPDALGQTILCGCSHGLRHHDERGCQYHGNGPDRCRCLRDIDTAAEDSPWLERLVAEAADAREVEVRAIWTAADRAAGAAEVRARVEAVLREPGNAWWHVGGTRCTPTRAIRAALAPADNDDGEVP